MSEASPVALACEHQEHDDDAPAFKLRTIEDHGEILQTIQDEVDELAREDDGDDEDDEDEESFSSIYESDRPFSNTRELLAIVHPGDCLQSRGGWRTLPESDYRDVFAYSMEMQSCMGPQAIALMQSGADVILLHRSSCEQFAEVAPDWNEDPQEWVSTGCRWIDETFAKAINLARVNGTTLYGNHIDSAVEWMIENCAIKGRPRIVLMGAYAAKDWGCVTAVGQGLERVVGSDRITVSPYAMVSNLPSEAEAWVPGGVPAAV
jgi:hypothetical protein